MLEGVDTAYLYDDSMPYYRHEIAAMGGLWAKVPVINGFSGTIPGHPGHGARPTVEELVQFLGPKWHGKLAVIEWDAGATGCVSGGRGTYRRVE